MEMLIAAVSVYIVYVVIDRFGETIDSSVELSNNKAKDMLLEQKYKNAKHRSKLFAKAKDLEIVSEKDLQKLLDGKLP